MMNTGENTAAESRLLDQLFTEYTAIYDVNLSDGQFTVLHLKNGTNAKRIIGGDYQNFDEFADCYADGYIYPEDRENFRSWLRVSHLREELRDKTRISMHYHSVPNEAGQQYYEARVMRSTDAAEPDHAMVAFRCIDEIMEKEISAQQALQHALDQSELRYEIIASISQAYTSIYRINLVKDTFEEIVNDGNIRQESGRSGCASAMLRHACDTLVAPEYREHVWPAVDPTTLADRLEKDDVVLTEYQMCDGNWHRLRYLIKKRNASGRVTHVLCTIRSVSDIKWRELNLLYAAQAEKRESDMKTRFLSNMSHDIRTPLNGLIGLVHLGNQYADDLGMQSRIREKASETLRYLVSLVNDVLDMSKLESGDLQNEKISFDLVDTLTDVNMRMQEKAEKKGIRYVIDWKKGDLRHSVLLGNPIYLNRILENIADNAVKFSEAGDTIWVWASEEMTDDRHVRLRLYCQDEGTGMSEETLKTAFSMFTQGGAVGSRTSYGGTGLGLAIAKKLTDHMGGTISLESELGVGTKACIEIPFELGEMQENAQKEKPLETFEVKGVRALVVEDNELNMEIATMMLENQGLVVTPARDGQEAVEIFEHSAPEYFGVIYMDLMMPRLDGLGAAKAIRAMTRPDARTVPIIAMSANAFSDDIINCRMAGMNRHIAKPLTEDRMLQVLQQCMAERLNGRDMLRLREEL